MEKKELTFFETLKEPGTYRHTENKRCRHRVTAMGDIVWLDSVNPVSKIKTARVNEYGYIKEDE